jgi:Tryptophan-associated transmembrane protein (Trp_oprn_chp)
MSASPTGQGRSPATGGPPRRPERPQQAQAAHDDQPDGPPDGPPDGQPDGQPDGGARGGLRGLGGRRSLGPALVLLAAGAVAALAGAGRAWATVRATSEVPQLGVDWTTTAGVSGNDIAPISAFVLLAVVFALGIAVTRGRGRWPVGVGLAGFGLAVASLAIGGAGRVRETALQLAVSGRLEGLPAGAALRVDTSPVGPSLTVAGGVLIAVAGLLTVVWGRSWPVLGERYRVPAGGRGAENG